MGVMPGVAAEERRFAGIDPVRLTGRWVRQNHRAAQDMQHLVGREDRAEGIGVPERRPGWHPEDELVDQITGDVNPVEYLTGLSVAPEVPGHPGASQRRGVIERRPR